MKQDDMEKEKKKCSGTYLEDSHPDTLKRTKALVFHVCAGFYY